MCESVVSTGNLPSVVTGAEETDIINDSSAHVHPVMLGASDSNQKCCNLMPQDIVNPHQQMPISCSHYISSDTCHISLAQSDQPHSHDQMTYPHQQIHSSCSQCTDSDGDSCHSLLDQNYQPLCDRQSNHTMKRRGCITWAMIKSPYFACVGLLCILILVIVGISLKNTNSPDTNLNPVDTSQISSSEGLTQLNIDKYINVSTSSTSSPNQVDIESDTQSTSGGHEYSMQSTSEAHEYPIPTAVSTSHMAKLFKAVEDLKKLLPCEPLPVKFNLKKEMVDSGTIGTGNPILDKDLHPQVVALKRCSHGNSYCGNDYGETYMGKNSPKCVSIKNKTITVHVWDRIKENELNAAGPIAIHLVEDVECECL